MWSGTQVISTQGQGKTSFKEFLFQIAVRPVKKCLSGLPEAKEGMSGDQEAERRWRLVQLSTQGVWRAAEEPRGGRSRTPEDPRTGRPAPPGRPGRVHWPGGPRQVSTGRPRRSAACHWLAREKRRAACAQWGRGEVTLPPPACPGLGLPRRAPRPGPGLVLGLGVHAGLPGVAGHPRQREEQQREAADQEQGCGDAGADEGPGERVRDPGRVLAVYHALHRLPRDLRRHGEAEACGHSRAEAAGLEGQARGGAALGCRWGAGVREWGQGVGAGSQRPAGTAGAGGCGGRRGR